MISDDLANDPIVDMIKRPFDEFMQWVIKQSYFKNECVLLLGETEASPESSKTLHKDSWAYRLYDKDVIKDHREFDRAVLALKYFHAAYNDDKTLFSMITDDHYTRLKDIAHHKFDGVNDISSLYFWVWCILFNDLGKIIKVVDYYNQTFHTNEPDHDKILLKILTNTDYFDNFNRLSKKMRILFIEGLQTDFNIGKAIQMECPQIAWKSIENLNNDSKILFFGHCLFDVLGAGGTSNPLIAPDYILNDNLLECYFNIIDNAAYDTYLKMRMDKVHVTDPFIGKLVCLTRCYDEKSAKIITNTINTLDPAILNYVKNTMMNTTPPCVELMYLPAVFVSIGKISKINITKFVTIIYDMYKCCTNDSESDVIIYNVSDVAKKYKSKDTYELELDGTTNTILYKSKGE